MNNILIRNWNSYVSNNDDIYILGDFAYKADALKINKILKKLKGKKYLIRSDMHTRDVSRELVSQIVSA